MHARSKHGKEGVPFFKIHGARGARNKTFVRVRREMGKLPGAKHEFSNATDRKRKLQRRNVPKAGRKNSHVKSSRNSKHARGRRGTDLRLANILHKEGLSQTFAKPQNNPTRPFLRNGKKRGHSSKKKRLKKKKKPLAEFLKPPIKPAARRIDHGEGRTHKTNTQKKDEREGGNLVNYQSERDIGGRRGVARRRGQARVEGK